jgi:hypothetical protein
MNCCKDLFSTVDLEKFVSKFTAIWTPTALWLVEQVESSGILYANCQHMHIETVYTQKHTYTWRLLNKILKLIPEIL